MRFIKNDVSFSDTEISEEFPQLADCGVIGQTADFDNWLVVGFGDVVGEPNEVFVLFLATMQLCGACFLWLRVVWWWIMCLLSKLSAVGLLWFVAASSTSATSAGTATTTWILRRLLAIIVIAVVIWLLLILWSELLLLVLLVEIIVAVKVFVLEVANLEKFDKAAADVVFVALSVSYLCFFCWLECYDGLACITPVRVLTYLNWFLNHAKPMEELLNVIVRDCER